MSVFKLALSSLVFSALAIVTAQASAAPAKSPILTKRSSTVSSSGKTRSMECLVYADGASITRFMDGIVLTEEKAFKLSGTYDAKIAEVAATKPQTKVVGPLEYSYEMLAHRTSATGTQEDVIISSFNGVKGEDIFNPSSGAIILKEVLNSICLN